MSAGRVGLSRRTALVGAAVVGLSAIAMACKGSFQPTSAVGGGGGVTDSTALVQLVLSPYAATLPAGGTIQYTVSGTLADGASVSPEVTYVTTGGSITADGFFTAGTAAGTELVIATQAGGPAGNPPCCTDTSVVTVVTAAMARVPSGPAAP